MYRPIHDAAYHVSGPMEDTRSGKSLSLARWCHSNKRVSNRTLRLKPRVTYLATGGLAARRRARTDLVGPVSFRYVT